MGWFKNLWKKVENIGHKIGIDKDHLDSVAGVVSAVNPIAGIGAGLISGDKSSIVNAITGTLLSNIASNKALADLSAQNRIPGLKEGLRRVFADKNRLTLNTVLSGGDFKKGLLTTLLQTSPQLRPYMDTISNIIGDIGGIDLNKFGLNDVIGIYSLIKYLKERPPEPPDLPDLQYMSDDMKQELYNNYKDVMNDELQRALEQTQINMAKRGLYRSGLLVSQENKLREQAAKNLANYMANLNKAQMEYNNQLKQQAFANALQRYGLLSDYKQKQMEALSNLVSNYLMSGNIFGQNQNDVRNQVIRQMFTDIFKPQQNQGWNPQIPDINLQDVINQGQNQTQEPDYWDNNINLQDTLNQNAKDWLELQLWKSKQRKKKFPYEINYWE